MSFSAILRDIVAGADGCVGAALMGSDGIAIEQFTAAGAAELGLEEEVGSAGAEFCRVLEEIGKASDALGGGAVSEVVVSLARFLLVFRVVDEEVFLVVLLTPDGNLGKARYLLRRHLLALRREL